MKLIQPDDPQYFEQSSHESYDRHRYKIVFDDGRFLIIDDYEQMRALWFQQVRNWDNCVVEVIDAKKESRTSTKGFGNKEETDPYIKETCEETFGKECYDEDFWEDYNKNTAEEKNNN